LYEGEAFMGNWLGAQTADLCTHMNGMGLTFDNMKKYFTESNDTYYSIAQNLIHPATFQGKGAESFLGAVDADINKLRPLVDGLGHLSSACDVFSSSISQASSTYDSKLAAIDSNPQVPYRYIEKWRDELISNFFAEVSLSPGHDPTGSDVMSKFLQQGQGTVEGPFYWAVNTVRATVDSDAEEYATLAMSGDFPFYYDKTHRTDAPFDPAEFKKPIHVHFINGYNDVSKVILSHLENWADLLQSAYKTFQSAIQNPDGYLSARDIFDLLYYGSMDGKYTNGSQGTDKPITITPYTTKDGKKGLLITLGGTDMGHLTNDDKILAALDTGEGLPTAYLVEIHNALETYMDEHPEMKGSELTISGYSLGGMQAQILADALTDPTRAGGQDFTTLVTNDGLHVANVITYASPVMGPPMTGVNYTMYDGGYDPVPLLSYYENPQLTPLRGTLVGLETNPVWTILQLKFQRGKMDDIYGAYHSLIAGDQMSWQDKVNHYIDRQHLYQYQDFKSITDVGNTSNDPFFWGHQLNMDNHLHYYQSAQLNNNQLSSNLKNIDPSSLGPTEYFSIKE
jgi:hypothetical protein